MGNWFALSRLQMIRRFFLSLFLFPLVTRRSKKFQGTVSTSNEATGKYCFLSSRGRGFSADWQRIRRLRRLGYRSVSLETLRASFFCSSIVGKIRYEQFAKVYIYIYVYRCSRNRYEAVAIVIAEGKWLLGFEIIIGELSLRVGIKC